MLSRRRFVGAGVATAATAALAPLLPRGTMAAQDGQAVRTQWIPAGNGPIVRWEHHDQGERELYCPTLLPLRRLTGVGSDPLWALWAWHHDGTTQASTSHLHRWSATSPQGPYQLDGQVSLPGDPPSPYGKHHIAQGDIAWDPIGRRPVSTPHILAASRKPGNASPDQDSFLLQSTNGGMSFGWLDGDNRVRLPSGAVGELDSVHTGNGRLLRDLDGELATVGGRYWWAYRGQRHDDSPVESSVPELCTPMLACAPSLASVWDKRGLAFATPFGNTTPWVISSFVLAGEVPSIHYTLPSSAYAPTTEWLTTAAPAPIEMTFGGPGAPMAVPATGTDTLFATGANIVRDRVTSIEYLVVSALVLDDSDPASYTAKASVLQLYRSVL